MKVKTKRNLRSVLLVALLVAILLYFFTAYFVKLWNMLPDPFPKIPESQVLINQIREISVLILSIITIVLFIWFFSIGGWFFTVALMISLIIIAITFYRFFGSARSPE